MTEVSIPTKSASKAASKTNLVFFIFNALVYKAIVYKVVSVEPIIVAAIKPIKDVADFTFYVESNGVDDEGNVIDPRNSNATLNGLKIKIL